MVLSVESGDPIRFMVIQARGLGDIMARLNMVGTVLHEHHTSLVSGWQYGSKVADVVIASKNRDLIMNLT